jgi:hypothetical protein
MKEQISSIKYIYNTNNKHYQIAYIQKVNINRIILNKPNSILDIYHIDFENLNKGEKCKFLRDMIDNITILRMLEIKDDKKVVDIVGKGSLKMNVTKYIDDLKQKLLLFTIELDEIPNTHKKLLDTVADMKNIIVSSFDNETLAYFIILHCFLCNLHNKNNELTYVNFLNLKINNEITTSEFIKKNDYTMNNLLSICKNYMINEYRLKPIVNSTMSWVLFAYNLYAVVDNIGGKFMKHPDVRYYFDDLRGLIPKGLLELKFAKSAKSAIFEEDLTPEEKARKLLGLKLDGSEDGNAKRNYHTLSKEYHPDKQKDQSPEGKVKAEFLFHQLVDAYELLKPQKK